MSTYNQVNYIKQYRRCLPDFNAKYALKKHNVFIRKETFETKNDVILAVDCNLISKKDELQLLLRAVLLHYSCIFDKNKIEYFEFSRYLLNQTTLSSLEDIKSLINSDRKRYLALSDTTEALNQLNSKFSNKDIVIITPGDINFYLKNNKNNKFHGISYKNNISLKNICFKTNGKYNIL